MVRKKTKGKAKAVARKRVAKAAPRKRAAKKTAQKPRKAAARAKAAPVLDVAPKAIDLLRSWSPSRYSSR